MPKPLYIGPERRIHSDDHDTVVTMLQLLDSHVKNYNEHKDTFKAHVIEDNANFDKIIKKLEIIFKYIYIGLGILIAINGFPVLINLIKFVTRQ